MAMAAWRETTGTRTESGKGGGRLLSGSADGAITSRHSADTARGGGSPFHCDGRAAPRISLKQNTPQTGTSPSERLSVLLLLRPRPRSTRRSPLQQRTYLALPCPS